MDHGRLPPREPGELEISAPVSLPYTPMPARTRVLLTAVALLAVAGILILALQAVQSGLAAQRAQATQTAAAVRQARAALATETASAKSAASARATIDAISTSPYSVAVPGCPLGDPLWQTKNFDPANPNFICAADSLQILSGARPHFGVWCCQGASFATKHDTQIHVFAIQPNVAVIDFSDGLVTLIQRMDGSWQIFGGLGQLASGTHSVPDELVLRIRYDGSQLTVLVNGVIYATLAIAVSAPTVSGVSLDFISRDYSRPSAIRVKDFSFTPLP